MAHINMRIPETMVSGFRLSLGLGMWDLFAFAPRRPLSTSNQGPKKVARLPKPQGRRVPEYGVSRFLQKESELEFESICLAVGSVDP